MIYQVSKMQMRPKSQDERPWGKYLLMAIAFLLIVWAVTVVLYPIVDAPETREELGVDRVRKMLEQEKKAPEQPSEEPISKDLPES